MFDSTRIIGQKQADKALQLMAGPSTALAGTVDFAHMWVKHTPNSAKRPSTYDPHSHITIEWSCVSVYY